MVPGQYKRRPRDVRSISRATSVPSCRTTASRATVPTTSSARRVCGSTPRKGCWPSSNRAAPAVIPGKADESELIFRIETDDTEAKMPPKKSGKKLTAEQIETLRQWVEQGASWTTHWAFEPPRKTDLPTVKDAGWPRNPIDRFILARLEAEGLHPSPEAEPTTLIRRVYLDLTGLPPTPEEVDAFLADSSDKSYEKARGPPARFTSLRRAHGPVLA